MLGQRWSDADMQLLREKYRTSSDDELQDLLPNRSLANILDRAKRLGLSRKMREWNVMHRDLPAELQIQSFVEPNQVWQQSYPGRAQIWRQFIILKVEPGGATVEDMETGLITFIAADGFLKNGTFKYVMVKVADAVQDAPLLIRRPRSHTGRLLLNYA